MHGHSAEGSLDGGSLIKKLVKRAVDLGRPSIALTDHGQMIGLATLWEEAKKAGIMPIHGIEVYIQSPWDEPKVLKNGTIEPTTRHMTVLFKTQKAYDYFCKISPLAHQRALIKYGDLKPLITWEELQAIGSEICLGSGCFGSAVAKTLMTKGPEEAEKVYQQVRSVVNPGNFFVEIMPHVLDTSWVRPEINYATKEIIKDGFFKPNDLDECGIPNDLQKPVNIFMYEMAKKYKDIAVLSEDSHISEKNDKPIQDLRLGDNWRFSCAYSMEPTEIWAENLKKQMPFITDKDIEEMVDNSYQLIENFKDYKFLTHKDRVLLPTMESVYGYELKEKSSKQHLKELINKYGKFPKEPEKVKIYAERLRMEIDVLTNNGYDFLPYFFTVEDVCHALRKMGYFASPRGSAASSLILYLLDISIIDPIEWNLPFSRFMNAGRIKGGSMADIDLDISVKEDCINYLYERYGQERVASISTSLTMKLKLSIRDVERQYFKKVRPETEEMLKMMIIPAGVDDEKWLYGYEDDTTGEYVQGYLEGNEPGAIRLKKYIEEEPEIWDTVIRCLSIPKAKGKHASGVIITPGPISDYMPVTLVNNEILTAYSMKPVENIGAVKFDFLGLKTLEALSHSFKSLKKEKRIDVPWTLPEHDERIFNEIINNNKHAGLFQISGKAVLPYLKKAPPKNVVDISNLIALCRPGALDAPAPDGSPTSAADYYIALAKGQKKPFYIHPSVEPILKETGGVVLYQEQLMSIVKTILNLDDMQADDWRRAVGKKDKKLMDKLCNELKEGAIKKGWDDIQAAQLIKTIIASSRYSFNKSHAASYGVIAYIEAWWKYHYPEYYWLGKLTAFQDKTEKIIAYLDECRDYILQPCIIRSHPFEWITEKGKIRAPLSTLKGVGSEAALRAQEAVKASLDTGWEAELQEKGHLHYRWGQVLMGLGEKETGKRGFNASTLLNILYNGTFDIFFEEPTNAVSLPVQAEQIKKALGSKATGGSVRKGQTVSITGIQDNVMLNIWRSENNAVYAYLLSKVDKVKEELIDSGFDEIMDEDVNYVFSRDAVWKGEYKDQLDKPRIDVLYNWSELSKEESNIRKYINLERGSKNKRICAVVGVITEVNVKISKNGNEYINLHVNTGTEVINNINLFGKMLDKYTKIAKTKTICMIMFQPNKWNSIYTPEVIGIVPFFEIG